MRRAQQLGRWGAAGVLPVALMIVAVGLLLARTGTVTRAADAPPAKTEFVTYTFGAAQWLNAPRTVQMSQGVTFGQDDATLKTDAADALLDSDQNLVSAQAHGPVHIYDSQDDLTGLHGSIDFTRHQAKLEDNIVLVVMPGRREANASSGSPRKQFKDPATLTCQAMTYDYRHKVGRIPGALTVRQTIQTKDGPETRTLTADAGLYNGRTETIQLVGNVRVRTSAGDTFVADTRPSSKPVVIGLKEGQESLTVPFSTSALIKVRPEQNTGTDNADDTDLTLPAPPPSAPKPAAPAPLPAPTPATTPPATTPAATR